MSAMYAGNACMYPAPSALETAARLDAFPPARWGVILAGGDGMRLRPLTRFISGDDRPKQFYPVLGPTSLLDETMTRAARSIAAERTVVALTTTHENYYQRDLWSSPARRLLQPVGRGTAPAILLSLLHILEQQPDAIVAVLPCDHHYSSEFAFTASLEAAFAEAGRHPDSVILLGARPSGPEVEFGWIQLGPAKSRNLFRVRGFEEKPAPGMAERLFREGALWNTFVMVGRAVTFLWMSLVSAPDLFGKLQYAVPPCDESGEIVVPASLYEEIPTVDFSREVLTPNAFRLLTMPLRGLEWHDLGRADRVLSVVQAYREQPPVWVRAWQAVRGAAEPALRPVAGFRRDFQPSGESS